MAGWVNKKEVLYEPNDRLMIPNGAVFDHPTDLKGCLVSGLLDCT